MPNSETGTKLVQIAQGGVEVPHANSAIETKWLSTEEAAAFLTTYGCPVSPRTLARWRTKRRKRYKKAGPPYRRKGDRIYYHRNSLMRWAEMARSFGSPKLLQASSERAGVLLTAYITERQKAWLDDMSAKINQSRASLVRAAIDTLMQDYAYTDRTEYKIKPKDAAKTKEANNALRIDTRQHGSRSGI